MLSPLPAGSPATLARTTTPPSTSATTNCRPWAPADGAYAGNSDLGGGSGTGAYDTAIDIGNNSNGASGGGNEGAFAGGGGLGGVAGGGNNDTAIDFGNNSGLYDGVDAVGGNGNYASESGNMTGYDEGSFAGLAATTTLPSATPTSRRSSPVPTRKSATITSP